MTPGTRLATLAIAFACLAPGLRAGDAPMVSILEKDGNPRITPGVPSPYLDVLEKMGLRVGFPDDRKVVPLAWDSLKRHNMVLLTSFPSVPTEAAALAELLDRYLESGGGVLYIGQGAMAVWQEQDLLNAWLRKHGAQFEWATIEDDAHTRGPAVAPCEEPRSVRRAVGLDNDVGSGELKMGRRQSSTDSTDFTDGSPVNQEGWLGEDKRQPGLARGFTPMPLFSSSVQSVESVDAPHVQLRLASATTKAEPTSTEA